jgi:hypothetical protein
MANMLNILEHTRLHLVKEIEHNNLSFVRFCIYSSGIAFFVIKKESAEPSLMKRGHVYLEILLKNHQEKRLLQV